MKRSIFYLSSLMALVLFCACAKKTTVDDVISKAVQAQGGAANLAAIKDQVGTWDMTMSMPSPQGDSMMTMNAVAVITYKAPNKIKFETMGPDGSVMMLSVFDGTNGWHAMMGQVMEMSEAEKQEHATMAETWAGLLYDYAAKGFKTVLMADTLIDGTTYNRVHATDRFGNVSISYCNAQSGLVERMDGASTNPMDKMKHPNTMYFSDYAAVDGVMWSGRVVNKDAQGNVSWEATLKEAKHNTGVSDEVFAMPVAAAAAAPQMAE